jgi:hypothetical protein
LVEGYNAHNPLSFRPELIIATLYGIIARFGRVTIVLYISGMDGGRIRHTLKEGEMSDCLEWDKPMTSEQAKRWWLTSGFVADELYRATLKKLNDSEESVKFWRELAEKYKPYYDEVENG